MVSNNLATPGGKRKRLIQLSQLVTGQLSSKYNRSGSRTKYEVGLAKVVVSRVDS